MACRSRGIRPELLLAPSRSGSGPVPLDAANWRALARQARAYGYAASPDPDELLAFMAGIGPCLMLPTGKLSIRLWN
jgi:hypothetical protein